MTKGDKCQCWVCQLPKNQNDDSIPKRSDKQDRDYAAIGYHLTEFLRLGFKHGDYDQLLNLLTEKEMNQIGSRHLCHATNTYNNYECYLRLGHTGEHHFVGHNSSAMDTAKIVIQELPSKLTKKEPSS